MERQIRTFVLNARGRGGDNLVSHLIDASLRSASVVTSCTGFSRAMRRSASSRSPRLVQRPITICKSPKRVCNSFERYRA